MTDRKLRYILIVAPGEGSIPISTFRDKYSEELAYPGILLEQKRPDNTTRLTDVHYSEICKSELRRFSAETQWTHLLRILGKLVDKKEYTDNERGNRK